MNKIKMEEKKKNRVSAYRLLAIFFLLFMPMLACQAITQNSSMRVSLEMKSVSLKDFFEAVKSQTGLDFIYNSDQARTTRVTVSSKNEPVQEVFDRVINGNGYTYRITGNIVTVVQQAKKSTRLMIGIVKDNEGQPLPGVNVFIKDTPYHALSDNDGNYAIRIPTTACTVTFSFVGMKTETIKVSQGGDTKINVKMTADNQIGEVVVTGIFKKAKESYTGAVSTVSSKDLQMYKGSNMLQTLKNADVSINMTVNNSLGSNPNNLPQLNIRGTSSLPLNVKDVNNNVTNTTNTPLIIMDGFEISLTKLMDYNDEEIESINILKDAAATAIYGSRGSNGVIVVITKTPEEGRLKVNAEIGANFQVPDISSYHLLNASQKLELERSIGLYTADDYPSHTVEYQAMYNKRLKAVLAGTNTDWLSKPLHNGMGGMYKLRLEGGSHEFRWGASASYNDIEGAMKGSSRKNFNGSITLMYSLKNLIFKNYTSIGVNNSHESKYGSFSDYVNQEPYNQPYDSDGNIIRYFDGFYPTSTKVQNPLYDATLNSFDKTGYTELLNSFSIEWKILNELTMRGQFSISSKHNTSDYFLPAEHSFFNSDTYTKTDDGFFRKGMYTYGTGDTYNYNGSLTLAYNKVFNKKHSVYAGVNYELAETNGKSYSFTAEGFSSSDISFLGNALQYYKDGKPTGTKTLTRRLSLTGNVNYTYDNRYYVDLSYRVDGSSAFGSDKKYAPFWSAGIGWNLHREKFLENNKIISLLRLKASYGETGSMNVSATGAKTTYEYSTDNKYMVWNGATLLGLGNTDLTWQKTKETNFGLEFGLFNGRIRGTFDWYKKKTSNLLSYMDLPLSMGFSSYLANVGEVENKGFETSLNVYLIRDTHKNLFWTIGGQLTYNRNRITKLSDAIKAQNEAYLKEDVEVSNLFYEGRPQNAIYAVQSLGIDPSTGNEMFMGRDGKVTDTWKASDKVYQGQSDPAFRGIANTMLQWKGFTLNLAFSYYWGGKRYNSTLLNRVEVTTTQISQKNVDERVLTQRWSKPGDIVFFKRISDMVTRASSRFVMDDNVLELQSISLEYKWMNPWLQKWAHVQTLTFGMNMADLWHTGSIKMERGISYPYARNIQGYVKFLF
jgi:TonB-linked SusC/RagA family outer membrane protein